MRGAELLDKLEFIDPAYIEAADTAPRVQKKGWLKWGAMAACFCLIAAAVIAGPWFLPTAEPTPPDIDPLPGIADGSGEGDNHTEGPWSPWTAHFNEATMSLDASRQYVPGYFTEELSEQELAALEPGMRMEYMTYSGHAGFDAEGNLIDIILNVTTSIPDTPVTVAILGVPSCYELPGEPVVSVCGAVVYTVYQWTSGGTVRLDADAEINGYSFRFTLDTTPARLEQAKEDFRRVLECFAYYEEGKPDLSAITAEEIPEFFDRKLTMAEARADPDFGGYMPASVPSAFAEESIRRYKDQNSDYLSGLWTKGYAELRWKISAFTESDAARLTSAADTENYDLSLYPIPRAESVPDELREIVNNPIFDADELTLETVYRRAYKVADAGDVDGWRMNFSVRFGDMIVEISSKGVEPEWVYEQLTGLLTE